MRDILPIGNVPWRDGDLFIAKEKSPMGRLGIASLAYNLI